MGCMCGLPSVNDKMADENVAKMVIKMVIKMVDKLEDKMVDRMVDEIVPSSIPLPDRKVTCKSQSRLVLEPQEASNANGRIEIVSSSSI